MSKNGENPSNQNRRDTRNVLKKSQGNGISNELIKKSPLINVNIITSPL